MASELSTVFPSLAAPTVPVVGSNALFPVHRIYCVGRNYADHAREMGADTREAPFFFMKPADAVLPVAPGAIGVMPYPPMTNNLHHEIELVLAIGRAGSEIAVADAMAHVWGYAVGLDMTRRDLQGEAKKQGRPWDTAKGFDQAAPIGAITAASATLIQPDATIELKVNGAARQHGRIDQMIWSVAETIAHLSRFFTLQPGDLIFTGTPAGVGAVVRGDLLEATIQGLETLQLRIA